MKTINDIYNLAVQAAEDGATVTVSLPQRSVIIDGQLLVDDGRSDLPLGVAAVDEDTALAKVEEAYAAYERSVPEHSSRDVSRWFHACDDDELTGQEWIEGESRPVARCRLELTMLAYILNRSLTKQGARMQGKWFWQSERYPQLVILTEWLSE